MQNAPSAFDAFASKYMVTTAQYRSHGRLSHTLLSNGKLYIPPDELTQNAMFLAMASDIRNGAPLYVNELRTGRFRLFMDLDFYLKERLTGRQVAEFVRIATQCVRRFYAGGSSGELEKLQNFYCIAMDAPSKAVCRCNYDLQQLLNNKEALDLLTQPGPPPPGAVPVDAALGSKWTYSFDTVFSRGDGSFFSNTERSSEGLLKHGFHLVFRNIYVTDVQALCMREALLEMLELSDIGIDVSSCGWANVLDKAVYTTSGLRMYGCIKCSACSVCKNRKEDRKECIRCRGIGKLDEGRAYMLHSVYRSGEADPEQYEGLKDNHCKVLRYTAIRYHGSRGVSVGETPPAIPEPPEGYPTWVQFPGCPLFGDSVTGLNDETKERGTVVSTSRFCKADCTGTRAWKKKLQLLQDPELLHILLGVIQTRFCKEYSALRISNAYRDDNKILVNVTGEGAHWCLNLKPRRDHSSNSIWFQFDHNGGCAKCFCRKPDTNDRCGNVPCGKFASQYVPLNTRDQRRLFPQTVEMAAKKRGR